MHDPTVIDVRAGLTEDAIEHLKRAERVQLGTKDRETAVLGLWPADNAEGPMTVLVIGRVPMRPGPENIKTLDMLGPSRGSMWDRVAAAVRTGDTLTLLGAPSDSIYLRHETGTSFGASYRLTISDVRWRPTPQSG
jgi:hypothetical protein